MLTSEGMDDWFGRATICAIGSTTMIAERAAREDRIAPFDAAARRRLAAERVVGAVEEQRPAPRWGSAATWLL